MTKKEIFNKVYQYFVIEKHPRAVEDVLAGSRCKYRTPEGNACAIGCLIPAELYSASFEGLPVCDLPESIRNYLSFNEHGLFLVDLQVIHDKYREKDNGDFHEYFKNRLFVLEKDYGLHQPT